MKCPKCGGRMTEMLFSVSCDAKCDQPSDDLTIYNPAPGEQCITVMHGRRCIQRGPHKFCTDILEKAL